MTDRELLTQTGNALNSLLVLWIRENGYDTNAVDASLDALAAIRKVIPDFAITATFAAEVDRRSKLLL